MARNLKKITNEEFWNLARNASPSFASHTAKATADFFNQQGWEAITRDGLGTLNEFVGVSLRVAFQKLNVSKARNPFADRGLVEVYDTPNGGFVQRMAMYPIDPVSPKYKNIPNYGTVDHQKFRKPKTTERFFQQNFDYQNYISIQEFQLKQIFLEAYGMGQWISGVMEQLDNAYTIQKYENTKEALNKAINSETYPLQDTQQIKVDSWTGRGTADELKQFILTVKDIASVMESSAQSSAFNSLAYPDTVNPSDYVMIARPGLKNRIQVELEVGAFNPDRLTLPWDIIEVQDFGGLVAYKEAGYVTRLYPVYDSEGVQIGWNEQEGQDEATVEKGKAFMKDPNEDVIAIIAQKGLIFENAQNPYQVIPAPFNAAGLYQTYWASRPNNALVVDPLYGLITISKP